MTDEVDVAGQPGGPSLTEQAQVDAEQKVLIERILAERAPAEAEHRRLIAERQERALAEQAERRSLVEMVKALTARVEVLERAK